MPRPLLYWMLGKPDEALLRHLAGTMVHSLTQMAQLIARCLADGELRNRHWGLVQADIELLEETAGPQCRLSSCGLVRGGPRNQPGRLVRLLK